MDEFDEDLKHAKTALSQLFSQQLSDEFENVVDFGEFDGDAIIEDIQDVDDSNIIEGICITDPSKQQLFCNLMIHIFQDHNYNIDTFTTSSTAVEPLDVPQAVDIDEVYNDATTKYIKDMDRDEFIHLICKELEALEVASFNEDMLISTLYNEGYDGHAFYAGMQEPKHVMKFAKLLKKANIALGKAKEIAKRIQRRIENENEKGKENQNQHENEHKMENNTNSKKLKEMTLDEFVETILHETRTNDTIHCKLGDAFDISLCRETLMANQIDCAKFIELGKKQFTKICRTATIIAGPANTLYRQIKTRYDAEEDVEEDAEEETQEEGKANTEEHTQEEGEEGKENKTCVSMTQQQFIEVILFHFHEYNRKKNMESDVETFKSILMKNSIDYMTFLSMKSKGFNALMKGTMKKGQSVGIYKAVAKRIEAERQESFVPLMEAQLSNYGDLRHQLSKQDTVTLLNLLHKDKEIDQRFVRDATKIHIFENKLKSKMPSIKTGVAIQIFHGLHDLVDIETEMETETKQKAETKTETERNMETKENTGPTMVALEDLTVDQFADVVIAMLHQNGTIKEDTFDFGKLRQVILEEKIDGKQFQKYSKKEFSTVFKKAHVPVGITRKLMKRVQTEVVIQLPEPESLAQAQTQPQTKYQPHVQTQSVSQAKPQPPPQPVKEITPKPSPQPVKEITAKPPPQPVKEITPKPPVQKITLDTRDLDGPSQYIAKLNEFQISKIVKNLADESLLKLFDQIKNGIHQNQINGKMLVQQINDKTEDEFKLFFAQNIHSKCTKLSSDLYLMLRNNNAKRKKVSDKSCEELIKYCVYTLTQKIGELIVDEEIDGIKYLELGKAGVTRKLNEYLSFGLARRLVANMDHYLNEAYVVQAQPQQSHHMLQLTPQHSLSRSDFESSVGIAASIQMEDEDGEEEEESKYSQTLGLSEVVPFINNYSMQMQSNGNAKDVESEENELAQFAVQCYKKSNKRSLKQCRQNVYKQDLNALLPHIVIDSSQKPLQVMKPKHGAEHGAATTISISFNKLTEDEEEDDDGEDEEDKKGQNLSGIKCEFVSFLPRIKAIYKINDKEDTFYRTLFEDVMLEKNGFSNTMHKYEIQEWLANYECNRIKYVIQQHTINYKQFRILSKHKLRDNKEYFGFLPKKRRRKLYDELVKYINNNR